MSKTKLSIVIPAYNTEKYISECLDSIIKQKTSDYEVLIIDDGSTDGTAKICDDYAKNNKQISVFHIKNGGVSNARNRGITEAKGELIWFVDSDDTIKPNAIKKISSMPDDCGLLVFGTEEFDTKNRITRQHGDLEIDANETADRMICDTGIRGYPFNKIFRLGIIKKHKILFDNTIKNCEDLLFAIQYTKYIKKTKIINDVLYGYRQRRGGAIHDEINPEQATAMEAFLKISKEDVAPSVIIKAKALFVKAYYKYRPILDEEKCIRYYKTLKECKEEKKRFLKKDKLLIIGYRFCNPIMQLLHIKNRNKNLYDYERIKMINVIDSVLPFAIFASFFIGTLNFSILSPVIIMGFVTFIFNLIKKNKMKRKGITKIELLYFVFVLTCAGLSIFSYDKIESGKQLIKLGLLIFISWQFIVYFRNIEKERMKKAFKNASLAFFVVTIIMYIIGIVSLGFNFDIKDACIFGVRIDRKMPRLISLAYADPNITTVFLSVPFVFFLLNKKTASDRFGLIVASILMGLTVSRGALVSMVPVLLTYLILSKEKLFSRIATVLKVGLFTGGALGVLILSTSLKANQPVQAQPTQSNIEATVKEDENEMPDMEKKDTQEVVSNPVREHLDFQGDGSGRLQLWLRAIDIISKKPITGIGLNNTYVYTKKVRDWGQYVHNTYLEITMEEGIIGGLLYMVVIIAIIIACWRLRKITIFPALLFVFLFSSQVFLSLDYCEVFFAGMMSIVLFSDKIKKNYVRGLFSEKE